MAQFMVTATYTDSAFAGMAHNPHNREEAIAKILSALDMSLESLHMTLDGKLFMVVSGTTEAAGSLMIVAGGSGSVDHITVDQFFGWRSNELDAVRFQRDGSYKPANAQ